MTMTPNTLDMLTASHKILYADKLQTLMPKNFRYLRDVKPKKRKLGKSYSMPVVLKNEQGFTYAKSQSNEIEFKDTRPGKIEEATGQGSQLFAWTGIDYETAAKSANSRQSYVDGVGHITENLYLSALRRLEIQGWYGTSGLGQISAIGSDIATITAATWAPGIWVGAEGAALHVAVAGWAGGLRGTNDVVTILAVDIPNRKITLSATPASTAANDWLVFESTPLASTAALGTKSNWNENMGIHDILGVPTTLHGITSASYSLWQANTFAVGSTQLTIEAIQDVVGQAVAKGLEGDANLYLNPKTVAKMITDLGGLRRFMKQDGNRYTIGAADLEVECQGVLVKIVSTPFVWEGYGYLFPTDVFSRLQAYALSSKVPGRGDELFQLTPGKGSYSMQLYSHETLFCEAPCLGTRISGIVN